MIAAGDLNASVTESDTEDEYLKDFLLGPFDEESESFNKELFTKYEYEDLGPYYSWTHSGSDGQVIDYVTWRSSDAIETSFDVNPVVDENRIDYNILSRTENSAAGVSDHRPVEAAFTVTHEYSITHDVLPVIITSLLL